MAGKNVLAVNDLNFDQEVVGSSVPVLVDFTATWCGPCRQIAPFVDQLADEFHGRAKVVKLDIDESPNTARRFQIRGVPTLMVFKGGQVVGQQVGMAPKSRLSHLLEQAL
jgi:thioredoxin 1